MTNDEQFQKNILRKLVDLPLHTAAGLTLLSSRKKVSTKKYMEDILIAHEKKNSKRDSKGRLQ